MKSIAPALVIAFLLAPAALAGSGTADVTIVINHGYKLMPADLECAVTVPEGASTSAALDAAVASGCLASWSGVNFGTEENPDRYVSCVNGECEQLVLAWAYYEDGVLAGHGIDSASLWDGAVVTLTYSTWASFFLP